MKKVILFIFFLSAISSFLPCSVFSASNIPSGFCDINDLASCAKYKTDLSDLEKASEDLASADRSSPAEYKEKQTTYTSALQKVNESALKVISEASSTWDAGAVLNVGNEKDLDITDPIENPDTNIFNRGLKLLVQIIGTFAIVMLIIGGILMITSEGDESRLQKGKNIFFYTVVGLLVAFISYILVQFVISMVFTSFG